MNPHTRIVSIKAATPPRSGDRYVHPEFGRVKLIRMAGGDSWHCDAPESGSSKRLILRPSKMKPIHEE